MNGVIMQEIIAQVIAQLGEKTGRYQGGRSSIDTCFALKG